MSISLVVPASCGCEILEGEGEPKDHETFISLADGKILSSTLKSSTVIVTKNSTDPSPQNTGIVKHFHVTFQSKSNFQRNAK